MIETVIQTKKIFSEQAQDHTNELQNKMSALDASLPSYSQQLDSFISTYKLLRDDAIKADFYIPKSPFTKTMIYLEEAINLLRDRNSDVDWSIKGLFLEAIKMMSQIINEYCFDTEINPDWSELQNNLFDQMDEHLMLNANKTEDLPTNDRDNEPFNLDNTPEALHLFDINFEIDQDKLYPTGIDQLDNSDSFMIIGLDKEEKSLESLLPMPKFLVDIFAKPSVDQLLGDEDETGLQEVDSNVHSNVDSNNESEDVNNLWTRFSLLEVGSGIDDDEMSTLEELEASLKLSNNNSNNSNDKDISNDLVSSNLFNPLESIKDFQVDEALTDQASSLNQLKQESDLVLVEKLKDQDFSSSDVDDTAIEESPIYQNNVNDNINDFCPATVEQGATIRIPLSHLGRLGDLSEELLVRKGILDIYLGEMRLLSGEAQKNLQLLEPKFINQNQAAIANLQNTFEHLSTILERTEQQTEAMGQDVHHLRENFHQVLKRPISSIVRKFPRILRDLSLQYGKQVELIVQGAEVGIDRVLAETIAEPLEILLRSTFEYGIESTHERQRQGKVLSGKIEVMATQTDKSTVIKVRDDGRGLGNNAGAGLSDAKNKLRKIGGTISVQSQIGKGSEFTIVLPNILSLMRVLLVESNQMCLAIPSKVILEVIPIDSHDTLPEDAESVMWRDRMIPVVRLNPFLKLNCRHNLNHNSSQTNQSPQLASQLARHKPANAVPSFLVIHQGNDLFALQTDGCWHDQDATFHQVEGDISLPSIFLGTVILGSNQAIALLNPLELVEQYLRSNPNSNNSTPNSNNAVAIVQTSSIQLDDLSSLSNFFEAGDSPQDSDLSGAFEQPLGEVSQSHEPENLESSQILISDAVVSKVERSHQPKVLIVESSANVRRYLAMTLAKSGFLTEQVQNGKEAIAFLKERLNSKLDIDVVITDLEMPQMGGFKLLSGLRDDKSLQSLPVVVLTARNNENDRKLALDLGAKAYFSKPYREQELITTLQQIISD